MAFRTNKMPVLQEKSASGSVATFNTALAMPLASCKIAVNAWQEGSGDPSPVNKRTIHGFSEVNPTRCGVNVWDEETELGMIDTTTGQDVVNGVRTRTKNFNKCVPNTTYYTCSNNKQLSLFYYDAEKNFISYSNVTNHTFTTPSNAYYFRFYYFGTTYDNDISINYPSSDTDYHAYTGNIYPIQLGQEVYGAEVDVVNGVAHVNRAIKVLDGSDSVTVQQNYIKSDACCGMIVVNDIYPRTGVSSQPDLLCDKLKQSKSYNFWQNVGYANMWGIVNAYVLINIDNTSLGITDYTQETTTTVTAKIKAWLTDNNIQLIIPIEPFDIQLTPTQIETIIGNNTIFADTGDIDLTYKDLDIAKRGSFREVFKLPS